MTRITFLVSHLHGTGHLSRALALAAACRSAGLDAQLISGGMPLAHVDNLGIDLVQLPPVRADGPQFRRLLDDAGNPVSEALLAERSQSVVTALETHPPDVLVTELYPFGRRQLRAEFEVALRRAQDMPRPPLILSSVRDILEPPSQPQKVNEAQEKLAQFYDGVLVHADPKLVTLDASWPISPEVANTLHYTGYVAPPEISPHQTSEDGADEILVTAGGGPLGRRLFETAVDAARIADTRRWRLLVGGADADDLCAELNDSAGSAPVVAERVRRDYREMLTRCAAAVGRCGYNTALDWLQAGVPGVFVPFADGAQKEQTLRGRLMHQRLGYGFIAADELTPANLLTVTESTIKRGRIDAGDLDMDGAAGSARLIANMLASRR